MIGGATRIYGIIGRPLGHSLSPALHNYVFSRLAEDARYVPFPVEHEEDLAAAVRGLAAAGVRGVNVTIPYKEPALGLADAVRGRAEAVGAANVLLFEGDYVVADNTDVSGIGRALGLRGTPAATGGAGGAGGGGPALVIGAGGSARAAARALLDAGLEVAVAARRLEQAEGIAAKRRFDSDRIAAIPWEAREDAAARARVVVNCTPLGMEGAHPGASPLGPETRFARGATVLDLVYRPLETPLLALAREQGARALDGLDVLIWQGLESEALWFGRSTTELEPFREDARRLLELVLGRREPSRAETAR